MFEREISLHRNMATKTSQVSQFLFLTIGAVFTLGNDTPVMFGDTPRYWSASGNSLRSVADFGQHGGSIVPVLLYSLVQDIGQAQLVNVLLWYSGGLIALWLINTGPSTSFRRTLVGSAFLIIYVSPIFLSWQSAVLAEPISLVFLTIQCLTAGSIFVLRDNRFPPLAIFCGSSLALVLSKPSWIIVSAPFLILVAIRQKRSLKLSLLTVPLFVALLVSVVTSGKEYVGGLNYNGWYSFTQTIDLGQNKKFADLIDSEFEKCDGGPQFLLDTRTIGFELGLPTTYPELLERCPSLVSSLNGGSSPFQKALLQKQIQLLATIVDQSTAIMKPAIYPVTLTKTADPFSAPAVQLVVGRQYDQYFRLTILVLLYLLLVRRIKNLLLFCFISGYLTFAAGVLSVLDGLEKYRHVLPASAALCLLAIIFLFNPSGVHTSKDQEVSFQPDSAKT